MAPGFKFGESLFGIFYPQQYTVAVLDDAAQADRIGLAFRETPFSGDIQRWTGREMLERYGPTGKRRRFWHRLSSLLPSEEGAALQQWLNEGARGSHFIAVHSPRPEQMRQAQVLLASHGARAMRHYGRWTVTDLPASSLISSPLPAGRQQASVTVGVPVTAGRTGMSSLSA